MTGAWLEPWARASLVVLFAALLSACSAPLVRAVDAPPGSSLLLAFGTEDGDIERVERWSPDEAFYVGHAQAVFTFTLRAGELMDDDGEPEDLRSIGVRLSSETPAGCGRCAGSIHSAPAVLARGDSCPAPGFLPVEARRAETAETFAPRPEVLQKVSSAIRIVDPAPCDCPFPDFGIATAPSTVCPVSPKDPIPFPLELAVSRGGDIVFGAPDGSIVVLSEPGRRREAHIPYPEPDCARFFAILESSAGTGAIVIDRSSGIITSETFPAFFVEILGERLEIEEIPNSLPTTFVVHQLEGDGRVAYLAGSHNDNPAVFRCSLEGSSPTCTPERIDPCPVADSALVALIVPEGRAPIGVTSKGQLVERRENGTWTCSFDADERPFVEGRAQAMGAGASHLTVCSRSPTAYEVSVAELGERPFRFSTLATTDTRPSCALVATDHGDVLSMATSEVRLVRGQAPSEASPRVLAPEVLDSDRVGDLEFALKENGQILKVEGARFEPVWRATESSSVAATPLGEDRVLAFTAMNRAVLLEAPCPGCGCESVRATALELPGDASARSEFSFRAGEHVIVGGRNEEGLVMRRLALSPAAIVDEWSFDERVLVVSGASLSRGVMVLVDDAGRLLQVEGRGLKPVPILWDDPATSKVEPDLELDFVTVASNQSGLAWAGGAGGFARLVDRGAGGVQAEGFWVHRAPWNELERTVTTVTSIRAVCADAFVASVESQHAFNSIEIESALYWLDPNGRISQLPLAPSKSDRSRHPSGLMGDNAALRMMTRNEIIFAGPDQTKLPIRGRTLGEGRMGIVWTDDSFGVSW
ncbi:MAG: hypothetical protein HYV07_12505 [Deltaproteobacteria bacterium]|nr:hypothetical protein [Deltaproteobacteria bacterium]